jgi:membrane protein required for beta-lactamase induction
MSAFIPILVVVLALVAAGSIAYIAWELTSKDVHDVLEQSLGRGALEQQERGPGAPPEGGGDPRETP